MSSAPPRPRLWPEPAQFNEAVQNLAITMADRELHAGQPELGLLGMPMPYAGNFADDFVAARIRNSCSEFIRRR